MVNDRQGSSNKIKAKKERLDLFLLRNKLANSRASASAMIMAGKVYAGEIRLEKSGQLVHPETKIEIRGDAHPWVSRGGIKLECAIDHFNFNVDSKVCLDIGASTGGFTDVLLFKGASRVYSVDVGHGQLDWKLRNDERVVVLEKTNARYLSDAHVPEFIDLLVCDVSFIGLQTILPNPMSLVSRGGLLIALIKPQFEVGRGRVGKGGIVRDSKLHQEVCNTLDTWFTSVGWNVRGIIESPIVGSKGNHEFLIAAEFKLT